MDPNASPITDPSSAPTLPTPSNPGSNKAGLIIAAIAPITILVIIGLAIIFIFDLKFLTAKQLNSLRGSKTDSGATNTKYSSPIDLDDPNVINISWDYRFTAKLTEVTPQNDDRLLKTDLNIKGLPNPILATKKDTRIYVGDSSDLKTAKRDTLNQLRSGQRVVLEVHYNPKTKNWFLQRIDILQDPNQASPAAKPKASN